MKDKKWWEKEWDRIFKPILGKEIAIDIGTHTLTFNEFAKQEIKKIVRMEIERLTKRHNLIAIGMERSSQKNKEAVKQVRSLIGVFERTRDSAEKYATQLKEILKHDN